MAKTPRKITGRTTMDAVTTKTLEHLRVCAVGAAAAFGCLFTMTSQADAQSRFGCCGLEVAHVPSVEGLDGFFFRVQPDLATFHAMTDQVIGSVAAISQALEARGTELIFVPLPTKAHVLPMKLGPEAEKYAYDADLAATIYEDQKARLSDAGVAVVDARRAFLGSEFAEQMFFKTDPRMTNHGLRVLTEAIAEERADWPLADGFVTSEGEPLALASLAHDVLQRSCLSDLPFVETTAFETVAQGGDTNLDAAPLVVFAGPSEMTDPALNLAGFLSDVAGRRAGVIGGETAFSALTAYVTSDAFRGSPPDVLIWAVPVWENLALGGDQPFREAVAAIEDVCVADLDKGLAGADRLRVALAEATFSAVDTLMLENSGAATDTAVFHFVGVNGEVRSRAVVRSGETVASGRFYMPLSGLWEAGVAYVDIETPLTGGALPVVALCRGAEG
mgnify:CR=1 FL=1